MTIQAPMTRLELQAALQLAHGLIAAAASQADTGQNQANIVSGITGDVNGMPAIHPPVSLTTTNTKSTNWERTTKLANNNATRLPKLDQASDNKSVELLFKAAKKKAKKVLKSKEFNEAFQANLTGKRAL